MGIKVALYGSRRQDGFIDDIIKLITILQNADMQISIEHKLAYTLSQAGYRLPLHDVKEVGELPADSNFVLSIGGDGTFLRTAHWLKGRELPVVGINTGHLGFLADNPVDDPESLRDLLMSPDTVVDRRIMLEVSCDSLPAEEWRYALNEVAFMKGVASMINVKVNVDGFFLADYRADGLLVATPTGSTAYNLSVGGPIIAPTLESIVLSPVAPHTLTLRPVVVSGDSVIEAVADSRVSDFRLSIDGKSFSISCGSVVRIKKASHAVLTLRKPAANFASTLRDKLLWGV